jgi:nicotinamide-nucleotide amidase
MLCAEILSTGDEVRTGALVDTNAAWLAEHLEQYGIRVTRHTVVGDHLLEIASLLEEIGHRADLALVTGGLGPTSDDVTAQAAAKALGSDLYLDQQALENVKYFFAKLDRPMEECNQKQAFLPQGAVCLKNDKGSAPGFSVTLGKCRFFFLPGVPFEMKHMFTQSVLPRIEDMFGHAFPKVVVKTLSTFGLFESSLAKKLTSFSSEFPNITLGFRSVFPAIQIKLYAQEARGYDLEQDLKEATHYLHQHLGQVIFSENAQTLQEVVGDLLRQQRATLALAESCTGGLIAHWVTNVPGSSDYFLISGVTYSNQAKINLLGVSQTTLDSYGAVHEQTAREMALGIRRISQATYGLVTTGMVQVAGVKISL